MPVKPTPYVYNSATPYLDALGAVMAARGRGHPIHSHTFRAPHGRHFSASRAFPFAS